MAVDIAQLKLDLDKVDDNCLDDVRRLLDSCLILNPESPLIRRPIIVQILQAWADNKDVFVQVLVTARNNTTTPPTFTIVVNTSATPAVGFVPAKRFLFAWFNAIKDR